MESRTLLESVFGRKALQKIEHDRQKEVTSARTERVNQIRKLESTRDAELATLTPRVNEAKERLDAGIAELRAASNQHSALYRRRGSVAESTQRKIWRIESELRQSASPKIDVLLAEIEAARRVLNNSQPVERADNSGEDDGWFFRQTGTKVFSNRATIEKRFRILAELRKEAEGLKTQDLDADELDQAIAAIRQQLPSGILELEEVKS